MADQDEQYEKAWILHHILDRMIGSKELVVARRKLTVVKELLQNAEKRSDKDCFSTGSNSEGMAMKGSDRDVMFICKNVIVLCPDQNTGRPTNSDGKSVLWMRKADCRPGYVTLEIDILAHGCSSLLFESAVPVGDRSFISSEIYQQSYTEAFSNTFLLNFEKNGPAALLRDENSRVAIDIDTVISLKCLDWPKEANEWVSRPRPHGWPDKALRDKIVHDGCHLVPVGDKTSDDTFLQWRISFITAERKLMYSLTHVQFLVYGLLKYFLKQISSKLKQLVGDTDILSSYIMKTVLFHAIESTPDSFWQEKHTFLCFMLCLNILITWVKAGYCPNYFIKRNNMFLGKVYGENREKLLRFLIDLHDKKWGCLSVGTFIQPSIGERIDRVRNGDWEYVLPPPSETERERDLKLFMELSTINYDTDAITVPLELLSKSKSDVDEFVSYVIAAHGLSKTAMETYGEHTFVSGNKEKYKCLRKSKKLLTPLATVCSSPGELTLATYYYNTGNYTKALNICVLTLMSPFKIYFGGYIRVEDANRYRHQICGHGHTLLQKAQQIFASDIKITKFSAQFCLPHLHHEFKRLHGDVLLIPPVPYALFLYFLCYHELGDTSTRDKALNLLRTVKYDEYQGGNSNWIVHNMLGVCYEVVGDTQKALKEYRDSLKVERFDQYINPAKERIERLNSLLNRQ